MEQIAHLFSLDDLERRKLIFWFFYHLFGEKFLVKTDFLEFEIHWPGILCDFEVLTRIILIHSHRIHVIFEPVKVYKIFNFYPVNLKLVLDYKNVRIFHLGLFCQFYC